ncbi:TIGR02679 domain-containing protein [Enterococcus sp. CWB-B31]|uniref:TIGR02679 domain-containing protein n=1 Tax=Enterococcus sp. CWB-B31 TaxID=2885159 RepID=UPI001E5339B5|nr:TIGR02679 domain-containing protein [Enterococcus sp. CWB-B31]MCB5955073.1 TIGR02679 domain-containing protein [Enterococcus sp. CWB-B31]
MEQRLKEAKAYFVDEVFQLLAQKLEKNYYQQGTFGKTIGKKEFLTVDMSPLIRFLGIPDHEWIKKKRLSIKTLENSLLSSRFQLSIVEFVTLLSGNDLFTKEEEQAQKESAYLEFLKAVNQISPVFKEYLDEKQLKSWHQMVPKNNLTAFKNVSLALNNIPAVFTRLPVFAYKMTGDPHAFDETQQSGRLLLQMLGKMYPEASCLAEKRELSKTEQFNELLTKVFLLRDDIMNFVAVNGLIGNDRKGQNIMWLEAVKRHSSWNVPLKELLEMQQIFPAFGNYVVVIENSGVYSILLDRFPELPMICSNGQFRYSVWVLLRKLIDSGVTLYYSGDMDPDGLLMADKLLQIFPSQVQLLAMKESLFHKAAVKRSYDPKIVKKLRQLKSSELIQLKPFIESGKIAYQEGYIQELIEEINHLYKGSF